MRDLIGYNWQSKWEQNDTPFHQEKVNPFLEKYWPLLNIPKTVCVFVPLCGKSSDLLWLASCGYHVVGVELSEIACKSFFVENKLQFKIKTNLNFICYFNESIELYCGDFFAFTADLVLPIAAVYDRGALIALPENLRQRYAEHLCNLLPKSSQVLLLVYESFEIVDGPPYPVVFDEIQKLYATNFKLNKLLHAERTKIAKHLCDKGYNKIYDVVYCLEKNK